MGQDFLNIQYAEDCGLGTKVTSPGGLPTIFGFGREIYINVHECDTLASSWCGVVLWLNFMAYCGVNVGLNHRQSIPSPFYSAKKYFFFWQTKRCLTLHHVIRFFTRLWH